MLFRSVIDYQSGSLRDDFDFGSLWCIKAQALADYIAQPDREEYQFAALYDLRLYLSRVGEIFHLNEFLYSEAELDTRKSGEKQFDYVNPRNREVQIEMEKACTQHLGKVGALIDTTFYRQPDFGEQDFEYEASVIIPVFNREKTVADAVKSALGQKANFKFNVIVVNNHSTDRTGEILDELKADNLIQIVPESHLGDGREAVLGCGLEMVGHVAAASLVGGVALHDGAVDHLDEALDDVGAEVVGVAGLACGELYGHTAVGLAAESLIDLDEVCGENARAEIDLRRRLFIRFIHSV